MSDKPQFNIFDTGLVLAFISAVIYFPNYVYLFGYYQRCNIALVDLHYSLQDMLFCNPWVLAIVCAFVITLVVGIFGDASDKAIIISDLNNKQKRWLFYILAGASLTMCCLLYWNGRAEASNRLRSLEYKVAVSYEGSPIYGYSYLTRSEDSYYLFKMSEDASRPEILILRADGVKEMVFGDALPPHAAP